MTQPQIDLLKEVFQIAIDAIQHAKNEVYEQQHSWTLASTFAEKRKQVEKLRVELIPDYHDEE